MAPVPAQGEQAPVKGKDGAKITLYWLEKSRSQRILWLLEELKLDYDLKTFKRVNMLAPPELKKIHPLGKSPVITVESDATNTPIAIAESALIVEYLTDHFGTWLQPPRYRAGMDGKVGGETESYLRHRYYMHYAEGTLMPYLIVALLMHNLKTHSPFFIRPLTAMLTAAVDAKFLSPNLTANWAFLESQLDTSPDGGDFLCGGELTGADIMMSFPLSAARQGDLGLTQERYPRLWAYVERLEGREAWKRAVEKIVEVEGKYDARL